MKKEKIFITGKNIELFAIRAERICCISVFFYIYYPYTVFPEGPKMLYKHWKKILLALTGFFWASCDSDPSSASEDSPSSSSIEKPSSSSATGGQESSSATEEEGSSSGDSPNVASSSSKAKSSSSEMIAPKYGVPMSSGTIIAPKYGVTMSSSSEMIAAKYGVIAPSSSSESIAPKYGVMYTCERKGKKITCEDGLNCTEEVTETAQTPECIGDQVCAKYGVVYIKETTYKCDDGKVYNYAEFQSKYNILDGAVDLYGCPSNFDNV